MRERGETGSDSLSPKPATILIIIIYPIDEEEEKKKTD